jgi:hypothetical protein
MTGANFSSWYNASAGTVFVEASMLGHPLASTRSPRFVSADAGGLANSIQILAGFANPAQRRFDVTVGGVAQAQIITTNVSTPTDVLKYAAAYAVDNFGFTRDALAVQSDLSGSLPTVDTLRVGAGTSSTEYLNGHIRRIEYYSRRLTNGELQGLTATPSVPVFTWSIVGLPPGLNANGPTISGTPTAPGFYVVDVTATNPLDTDDAALALTINPSPAVSAAQSGGWGKFIRQ